MSFIGDNKIWGHYTASMTLRSGLLAKKEHAIFKPLFDEFSQKTSCSILLKYVICTNI